MYRIGIGYDIHKKSSNRKLILGGILISNKNGLVGHSDADIVIHTICDSILGALNKGDIGEHFSNKNPKYRNAKSSIFLKKIKKIMEENNFSIVNIDMTIICEKPKLTKFKSKIKKNISKILDIEQNNVSVKATTSEGLGEIGNDNAIACKTVVLLRNEEN